jgi:leucyl aminopeptidase
MDMNRQVGFSGFLMCCFVMLPQLLSARGKIRPPAEEASIVISTDAKVAPFLIKQLKVTPVLNKKISDPGIALLAVKPSQLEKISAIVHEKFHRCGGFMLESGEHTLRELAAPFSAVPLRTHEEFKDLYQITQQEFVGKLTQGASEGALVTTIQTMSAYTNRYYRAATGKESQQWVKDQWQALTQGNPAVSVALFTHGDFPQPSVILTWKGKSLESEVVILGGHGDSIAGFMTGSSTRAPGADDNASGIATITEVIRLLVANNFQPDRTIHFISYAAEEVGLRGSDEIARRYKQDQVNVVGVMQLDMVNFSDNTHDIVLITDNTNAAQNAFVKNLVTTYLPQLSLGENPCGYACSDHASWHRQGFPASFPFEAAMESYNSSIHTARDTLDKSGDNARHALPFVTLAGAYVVEMGMR